MSTTTKARSTNAKAASEPVTTSEPGYPVGHHDRVRTILATPGTGITEKQAVAVALRDAGMSNADGGALVGVKSGGFGNLVVNGLRALGREAEITATSTGGGGSVSAPKIRGLKALIEAELARVAVAREALAKKVSEAQADVVAWSPAGDAEARVKAERDRIEALIVSLRDEQNALTDDPSAFIDAGLQAAQEKLARIEASTAEALNQLDEAEAELTA